MSAIVKPTIFSILDFLRSEKTGVPLERIIGELQKISPPISPDDLWHVCRLLGPKEAATPSLFKDFFGPSPWFSGGFFFNSANIGPFPSGVRQFISETVSIYDPQSLLGLRFGEPVTVASIFNSCKSIKTAVGTCAPYASSYQIDCFRNMAGPLLGWSKIVEWTPSSDAAQPVHLDQDWDLILGFPPVSHSSDAVRDLVSASKHLAPKGVAFFVIPPSHFNSSASKGIVQLLHASGLRAEAFLSLPQQLRPANAPGVNWGLLIVGRGNQERLFVGEIQTEPERSKALLSNFRAKSESHDTALGVLVEPIGFRGYEALKVNREYAGEIERQALPLLNLSEVADAINVAKRDQEDPFEDAPNSIYLPLIGASAVVTSIEHLKLKPQNYAQIVLKADVASADYLAGFFNSELGRLARGSLLTGNFISKINKAALEKGLQIPLPPLDRQTAVIETDVKLRDIATDVDGLRKQLWARPAQAELVTTSVGRFDREERFEDWLQGLPFPLASILWNFHASDNDPKEQFNLLLNFFEGLAEFIAAILLSAAKRDDEAWAEVQKYLAEKKDKINLEHSSFGTWVGICSFTGKMFRRLEAQSEQGVSAGPNPRFEHAFGTQSSAVIDTLISKELIAPLSEAGQLRNKYKGHYGMLGEATAKALLVSLRNLLSQTRSAFGSIWERYKLVLPTNQAEFTGDRYELWVSVLQGNNTPFRKEPRALAHLLKRSTLYLLDEGSAHAVELLPLVVVSNSPEQAVNACYFYSRRKAEEATYVSYHFEHQADRNFPATPLFNEIFGR